MPVLALHCSVCKSHYYSKSEWLGHLLEERHQSLARLSVVNWGETQRSRVLVVFARLPTGKDDKIIQYLSGDFGTYVVDFVWWPERPRVGFVRFESKEKAKEVLGSLHNHQFKIDPDQFCEVKDGGSISELEWDGFLPETIPRQGDSRKAISERPLDFGAATSITPKSELVTSERQSCPDSPPVGSPKPSNEGLGLRHHLSSIRTLIEIPDEEYDAALDILHRVQTALSNIRDNQDRTNFNAVISRHWNLKLQLCPIDLPQNIPFSILIYKYLDNEHPSLRTIGSSRMRNILKKFIVRHGKGKTAKTCFFTYDIISMHHNKATCGRNRGGFRSKQYNIELPNTGHHFGFNILRNPGIMVDAQVWRLIKYMCTFDPHCIAVLSLVYHWSNFNSIAVGKLTQSCGNVRNNPIGFNWLLIHFFQKQGLIPPTKLVLERPHKSQLYKEVDIGFSDCPKFVISWKTENGRNTGEQNPDGEEFAKMVFKLLYKFFIYCGTTLKKCRWIVNTRDAELISIQKLFSSGQVKNSKLSESELLAVKSTIPNECREKIVMLHPFNIDWRISVNNAEEAFRAMTVTGKKLKAYLTKKSAVEMNLEEFLQLLKV